MADQLSCSILTPEGSVYEGEVQSIVAPAVDGELGILKGHAPLITALGKGKLRVSTASGNDSWSIEGGFLEVLSNKVVILAEKLDK